MTLISQYILCYLCGKQFGNRQVFHISSEVELEDPLWSAMRGSCVHMGCLTGWKHRDAFIEEWNTKAHAIYGPTVTLVKNKNGTLSYGKKPLRERVVLALLTLILAPLVLLVEGSKTACWYVFSRPSKCQYCKKRLNTRLAQQCFNCGMDWHNPNNVFCSKGTDKGPAADSR